MRRDPLAEGRRLLEQAQCQGWRGRQGLPLGAMHRRRCFFNLGTSHEIQA